MIKVKIYGNKGYTCQALRIAQGFKGLGHDIVSGDDYDLIYSNNFDFSDIDVQHGDSALYQGDSQLPKKGFKIFNVLDIPPHIPDFPVQKLKDQLTHANIVTCISDPVKEQLAQIGVEAHVIWNPIKDVFYDEYTKRDIECLYVGRCEDPNKRFHLLDNIEKYVIGPSGGSPSGKHLGLVNNVSLNQLYNSAKIVALPTKFEGLGLPALEAMAAGAVPLVCSDNPNSKLCPDFCVCEPTIEAVTDTYNKLRNHFTHYQSVIIDEWTHWVQFNFSKFKIAQNILDLFYKYK
jgi:hypothetical protein